AAELCRVKSEKSGEKNSKAIDEERIRKYKAALKIQSWFRGCRVRVYLRYLNKMAVLMQKCWRGYLRRKYFRETVEVEKYFLKFCLVISNISFLQIQKRWRGYYVRKYIHDFYTLKKYLNGVSLNNILVRGELKEYADMKEKEEEIEALEKKEKEKNYQARRTHYLLSTAQIPGIYNSPRRISPDPMELLLQQSKPLTHKKQEGKELLPQNKPLVLPYSFQGPFRDHAEVLWQRYKPLDPTLRVAESSNSPPAKAKERPRRGEWRHLIHENEFLPFSSHHKNDEKYEPSLHRSGKYGREAYGTKHFRDMYPEKWIADKVIICVLLSFFLFVLPFLI
uniref:Spermatogenesis associated 17 n=1 Tax=Malurus cyaneus samueli TaxID=2593467 RepID=A0A8C5TH81_9PASS